MFIIEHCIGMFKHYKDQRVRNEREPLAEPVFLKMYHDLDTQTSPTAAHVPQRFVNLGLNTPLSSLLSSRPDSTVVFLRQRSQRHAAHRGSRRPGLSHQQDAAAPPATPNRTPRHPAKENGRKAKQHRHSHSHGHGHSHGGNCHSDQEMKDAGIASIAWMVIMGDGMHNFSDGLAIGAAFSANLTGGISTSVAVFCHELPHELGDFAVLLKAGMSVKQAIVYNLLSALMAYVGMLIGTVVGQYTHNVTNWIFAITAGMFLYVALVDMLPEMLHGDSEDHKRCQLGHFILQNLGMLTGFGIMLLIAIFEDRIVFDFGF
uniref:Solute carrier family 39 member 10 n=1 Tax=Lates calcarifer TaxID=8187 RepID=A0A4W6FVM7_LATCA